MKTIIEAKQVSFAYDNGNEEKIQALENVSLTIGEGEFVAILGHNGSGKSTLAKNFNGILIPTEGTVLVDSIDTKQEELIFEIRQRVGMVFQNPDNQIVATVVEQDVAFAPENLGVEPKEIRKRVDDALRDVDMEKYKDRAPHQLSGGQKQRVAIAGIIAMRPKCIVLDEATAMLDPKGRKEVLHTVRKLNKEYGTTIVHITHFMEEAVKADRVIIINNGKLVMDDCPQNVFVHVEQLRRMGLSAPQVTELMFELHKEGIDVPMNILDEQSGISILKSLLEG